MSDAMDGLRRAANPMQRHLDEADDAVNAGDDRLQDDGGDDDPERKDGADDEPF